MYNGKRIVALIPARGGSKGLPRKNIRPLSGRPLIAWTIDSAKSSRYVDWTVVSTEDAQIAEIARENGAAVPFMRPEELARDTSRGMEVVLHAIRWIRENEKTSYDLLLLLQPTSPLRNAGDIDKAIDLLFEKEAKAIVSICETEHHPYRMNTLPANGCLKDFIKQEARGKNRQELPVFYRVNGCIYLAYFEYLVTNNSFFSDRTFAYVMPRERSVDMDGELDFELAEIMLKRAGI